MQSSRDQEVHDLRFESRRLIDEARILLISLESHTNRLEQFLGSLTASSYEPNTQGANQ